jgi:hypothetical protein
MSRGECDWRVIGLGLFMVGSEFLLEFSVIKFKLKARDFYGF